MLRCDFLSNNEMRSFKRIPDSLLDHLYDAADDDKLWPSAITRIAEFTGGQGGIMLGLNSSLFEAHFEYNGSLDPVCSRIHRELHVKNPWSSYMIAQPVGKLVTSDEIISVRDLQRTMFYADVLHPQSIAHNAMACLGKGTGFIAAFNICRAAQKGAFSAEELALQRHVLPHVQRAVTLGMRVKGYKALQLGAYNALELMTDGLIVLDREGRVLFANASARKLQGNAVSFDASGIRALDPGSHAQFIKALKAVLNGATTQSLRLRSQGAATVTVVLSSLYQRDLDRLTAVTKVQPAVMLFITTPHVEWSGVKMRLAALYGLTEAEATVALAVAKGGSSPREVAAHLKLSVNTVKTHLRRTYAKMNVRGYAELTLIVAGLKMVR